MNEVFEPQSKYFQLREMEHAYWNHQTKQPHGHPLAERYPKEHWGFVSSILFPQLDVIREAWGSPLHITPNGGYRSPNHNRALGGVRRSEHVQGRAVDLRVGSAGNVLKFWRLVDKLHECGTIAHLSGVGTYPENGFVHLDFMGRLRKDGTPRRWGKKTL